MASRKIQTYQNKAKNLCTIYFAFALASEYIFTHTRPFNGPFSRTTRVGRYQKGKTYLDFTDARDSQWQWHQLDHMQVCTSFQTDNHASTPPLSFFTGRMPFLPPNQQRQSKKGKQRVNAYSLKQNIIVIKEICS